MVLILGPFCYFINKKLPLCFLQIFNKFFIYSFLQRLRFLDDSIGWFFWLLRVRMMIILRKMFTQEWSHLENTNCVFKPVVSAFDKFSILFKCICSMHSFIVYIVFHWPIANIQETIIFIVEPRIVYKTNISRYSIAKLSPSSTQLGWVSYIITPEQPPTTYPAQPSHPPHSLRNPASHPG